MTDILDFSKIESGRLFFENVPFNLKEVSSNVCKLFETRAQEKNLQLTLRADEKISTRLSGDYVRLSQILANLLSNAIKFTQEGSVELSYVLKEMIGNQLRVEFTVKDTGIGISKQQLGRIFENFSQADISIARKYGGTGLGLAISKKLIEQQGGTIAVESILGQGSSFRVALTFEQFVETPNAPAEAPSEMAESPQLNGMKILVAEDNYVNILVLTTLLKQWGASFTVAKDGQEALDFVDTEPFDAILMDIQMPNMDGKEATLLIRQSESAYRQNIPIIALTAEASVESQQDFLSSGFNAAMTKPFQPEELFGLLKQYFVPQEAN